MAYDVIVLAGQSNAEGHGVGEVAAPYEPNENIVQLFDPQPLCFVAGENGVEYLRVEEPWIFQTETAIERTDDKNTYGNFALNFAAEYVKANRLQQGRKVLLIKAAVGGTGFTKGHWGVGDVLFRRMLDMLDEATASKENRIVAFLWHQGEHDAFENAELDHGIRYEAYKRKFSDVMQAVKDRYAAHTFPLIAGDFVPDWRDKNAESCKAVWTAIKDVCQAFGGETVTSDGLLSNRQKNGNTDDIHFCRDSLYELGKRYYQAYENWLKKSGKILL